MLDNLAIVLVEDMVICRVSVRHRTFSTSGVIPTLAPTSPTSSSSRGEGENKGKSVLIVSEEKKKKKRVMVMSHWSSTLMRILMTQTMPLRWFLYPLHFESKEMGTLLGLA